MDGKGYPDGLKGDELDQLTKILVVVDSYDAMTSRRNYRRNLNMEEALCELQLHSGSQFDKETVDVFAHAVQDFVLTFNVSL
jgi:HD-GYP domain-containing protein (c-di-GMP phosphodiesterase class II)